ncbi:MAG: YjbF family lipoprotein [Pseudodonghicola sp.]|nr:YjbF family lipoprotein [Pseudodonghicola sp.]
MIGKTRVFALCLLVGLVPGCAVLNDTAKLEKATNLVADGLSNRKAPPRTGPEQIDRAAGVLAVQWESNGQTAGLGLISRHGNTETWSTLDGTTLTLENGVVIGTAGLGPDLFSVDVDPVRSRPLKRLAPRIHRYVDGENHVQLSAFVCTMSVDHDVSVPWDGKTIKVSRFDEVCTGANIQFKNYYLYSKSGYLLGSRQWIGLNTGFLLLHMPQISG